MDQSDVNSQPEVHCLPQELMIDNLVKLPIAERVKGEGIIRKQGQNSGDLGVINWVILQRTIVFVCIMFSFIIVSMYLCMEYNLV